MELSKSVIAQRRCNRKEENDQKQPTRWQTTGIFDFLSSQPLHAHPNSDGDESTNKAVGHSLEFRSISPSWSSLALLPHVDWAKVSKEEINNDGKISAIDSGLGTDIQTILGKTSVEGPLEVATVPCGISASQPAERRPLAAPTRPCESEYTLFKTRSRPLEGGGSLCQIVDQELKTKGTTEAANTFSFPGTETDRTRHLHSSQGKRWSLSEEDKRHSDPLMLSKRMARQLHPTSVSSLSYESQKRVEQSSRKQLLICVIPPDCRCTIQTRSKRD